MNTTMLPFAMGTTVLLLVGVLKTADVYADSESPRMCVESVLEVDIDGDGGVDCLRVKKSETGVVLEIRLANSGKWHFLQEYVQSDEVLSVQSLSQYKNPKFIGPRKGEAVRLVFPEKSSALFYWNAKKLKIEEFWESD